MQVRVCNYKLLPAEWHDMRITKDLGDKKNL